ncbi:MAG: DUF1028 domain-containing protein [Candidatus Acidiferrum sp.]|jgi:uncharacterized Ntn-hydrolase superfamily protein
MNLCFLPASRGLTLTLLGLSLWVSSAGATYSIIACDTKTRACGVAVQTNNLAVGASVPYAQAGVGALVSQFETNPAYGPRGLALLAQGKAPAEVLKQLLAEDGNFEDRGPEARQVAVVSLDGKTAVHTGEEAQRADWAGALSGFGYSVQGNSLVSANVIAAMEQAFLKTPGTLGERLLAALSAGDAAGGQKTGRESAALLVKTPDGWPIDIDLRVDHSADPVGDLRMLFNMQTARQQIVQARRAARSGDLQAARALTIQAVSRASMWPRIWLQAAHVAIDIEEPELALQYLNVAFSRNPAWAEAEIGDGTYATLGRDPLFHKWVAQEQEANTLAAYRSQKSEAANLPGGDGTKNASPDRHFRLASELLEVGHSEDALVILRALLPVIANASVKDAAELHSLLADGYAAQGDLAGAIEHAQAAAKLQPSSVAAGKKTLALQAELANRR